MQQQGVWPNFVTFVGVLKACASIIVLEEGRSVHQQIIANGLESDVFVGSSLVDMYAKCGGIEDAWRVFKKRPSRNVVTWNTILGGCAMHRHGREALKHFEWMCEEGVQLDDITFLCLLSACSHAGLVNEGMLLYASMIKDYMIPAKLEHYTCVVDLNAGAGHLQEAENMVMGMPCKPQVHAWMALLSSCRILVMWRWQNSLPNEFLKWSLKMMPVMSCFQTSMLRLVTCIFVRILNSKERKKVQRNNQVAPGLK
jgi:pentatricopeptide repeat protein